MGRTYTGREMAKQRQVRMEQRGVGQPHLVAVAREHRVHEAIHDILAHHDFERDVELRRALIELGVFFVPIATKQCSISAAHTADDIALTLTQIDRAVSAVWSARAA